MWYLFAERRGETNKLVESPDNQTLLDLKRTMEADGWTCTIVDEKERQRYRQLTADLITIHPDLAV